jgi:hypothetical protein
MVRFTSALDGPIYLREKNPRYSLYKRLGGPRADLDAVEKRKILPLPIGFIWLRIGSSGGHL